MRLRHLSIRRKLIALLMAMSTCSIAVTATALVWYELARSSSEAERQLEMTARLIGANTTAALSFNDRRSAADTLGTLARDPGIVCARLFDGGGHPFADYASGAASRGADGTIRCAAASAPVGHLHARTDIVLDGDIVGALYLESDSREAHTRAVRDAAIAVGIGIAVAIAAFFLSAPLQSLISVPLMRLSQAAEDVATRGDYSVRVLKQTEDEIGWLTDRFNDMLSRIETAESALRESQHALELRVDERTRELQAEVQEHERTEQELVVARDAAEAANRAKSAFLATMSHELRTPLNAIIGYSEMLQEEAGDGGYDTIVPDLVKITGSARHLLALINDILDLSKIEAGRMELAREPFDVPSLLQDVAATARRLAADQRNTFEMTVSPSLPTMVGDVMRLKQVLLNMVSNAAKFTKDGRIDLAAATVDVDGTPQVQLTVADTGIGMTDEEMSRLFREFSQADSSTSRKFGGTGLGLAISKRLCRMMGGEITCRSRKGEGSTFTIVLPLAPPERQVAAAVPAPTPEPPVQAPRVPADSRGVVMVIDDDPAFCEMVSRALSTHWDVRTFQDGYHAIEQVDEVQPSVIVLDLMLPALNGYHVSDVFDSMPYVRDIPLIVVSAKDISDDDRHRLPRAYAVLQKGPSLIADIRAAVAAAAGTSSGLDHAA